jgi:hypothetical protein
MAHDVDRKPLECSRPAKPVAQAHLVLQGLSLESSLADLLELQADD